MTKQELFRLISNANISDNNRYNLFRSLAAFEKMFKDSDVLHWVNDDGDESDQLIDSETQLAVFLHHGLQGEDEILFDLYNNGLYHMGCNGMLLAMGYNEVGKVKFSDLFSQAYKEACDNLIKSALRYKKQLSY